MNETSPFPPVPPLPLRGRSPIILLIALAVLVAAAILLMTQARLPWRGPRATQAPAVAPAAPGPQLPGALPRATVPGKIELDDFVIVIPPGWERRSDWEDQGPGTKLFLIGPKVGDGQLAIGIDVYPLRTGTTLQQFVKQYSSRWNLALVGEQAATLSGQPARMLALTENGQDKMFLLTVWRSKGFAIGMFGPSGHDSRNTAAFRSVVDTFQLYE